MKENRDYQLKVRLTNSEKDQLARAAESANMSISEFVRMALYHQINK